MGSQVISKQRVADHGEVLTGEREVNAMLDLVKSETERIDSRFLEPACGNGNFLAAILGRKLAVVEERYSTSQVEFERYAVLAVTSLYGIDLLQDNVQQCRARLLQIFDDVYSRLFGQTKKGKCLDAVDFILGLNVVRGDALSLKTVDPEPRYIVFPEWSPLNGNLLKRRDFAFHSLVDTENMNSLPLFSDLGEDAFIPEPVKDFSPVNFMEIADVQR